MKINKARQIFKTGIEIATDLFKGSLQSKMPFNPKKDISNEEKNKLDTWQSTAKKRHEIPEMSENTKNRSLHKLHNLTEVRRHPETNERMFLLHRGMGEQEQENIKYRDGSTESVSSWTPDYDIAKQFAATRADTSKVLSSWIPESQIKHYLPQAGNVFGGIMGTDPGPNRMKNEKEVIVKPHKLILANSNKNKDINSKINTRFNKDKEDDLSHLKANTIEKWKNPHSGKEERIGERKLAASESTEIDLIKSPIISSEYETDLIKADPRETEKKFWDALKNKKYDESLQHAKQLPKNFDIWQQIPSSGHELPEEYVSKLIDTAPSDSGFGFEMSSNLPDNASSETLQKLGQKFGKDDGFITSNIEKHPNFKLDETHSGLKTAGDFWNDYESQVAPMHFATVKSMFTNKPETWNSFRGDGQGTSEHSITWVPHLHKYAKATQDNVMKDKWIEKKDFNGEPHIKVYRGVGGDYGKQIHQHSEFDPKSNSAKSKTIAIKTAPLTSWTTNKEMAARFAHGRGGIEGQDSKSGAVLESWMPVKNILHSGTHRVVFNQKHAHPQEEEIVFGHPDEKIKLHTKNISFQKPEHEYGQVEKANIITKPKKKDNKLAASENNTPDLNKGSLQSRNKFNPISKENLKITRKQRDWTHNLEDDAKQQLPPMSKEAKVRAFNKLSNQTTVRRHPETNERMFLMHRGMGEGEYKNHHRNGYSDYPNQTRNSWTPDINIAKDFGENVEEHKPSNFVSAWIPESSLIHSVNQFNPNHPDDQKAINESFKDHEVKPEARNVTEKEEKEWIVEHNHKYPHANLDALQNLDTKISNKKLAASESIESNLIKGEKGDWKKEGYKLKFHKSPDYKGSKDHSVVAYDKAGKAVGVARIREHESHIEHQPTQQVKVDKEHQRKGLASAMYSLAEKKLGKQMKPSESQTKEGKSIWEQSNRPFGKKEEKDIEELPDLKKPFASRAQQKFAYANPDKFGGWKKVREWQKETPKNIPDKVQKSNKSLRSYPKRYISDKIKGGLSDNKSPSDFDKQKLKDGIKVEMEHTDNPSIAQEIAQDHLAEDKNYYKKLKQIEKPSNYSKTHKLNKSSLDAIIESKETDMMSVEKGGVGDALRAVALTTALASGADLLQSRDAMPKQQETVSSYRQIPMKERPEYKAGLKEAADIVQRSFKKKMLNAISATESNNGKNLNHKPAGGMHDGSPAIGRYGLMPITIKETISKNPELSKKYGQLVQASDNQLKNIFHQNPQIGHEVASHHLDRIMSHFGQDPHKIAMSWINGISGTKNALKQGQDIKNHWHVKKVINNLK